MAMRTLRRFLQVVAVASVLTTAGSELAAATRTWNGGGGNDNWSNSANWGGASLADYDSLVFAGNSRLTPYNDLGNDVAPYYVSNITFDKSAGAFTLSGKRIALFGSGNIGFSGNPGSAITQTINADLTFAWGRTFTTESNGSIVVNGSIGFSGTVSTLTKNGAGTLTLSGQNSYAGATTINTGTLLATRAAALPGYNTALRVYVLNGATLAVRAGGAGEWTSTEIDDLLGPNPAAFKTGSKFGIDVSAGNSFTYANDIGTTLTGKGFVKTGAGTLILSGINTYTGGTTVSGGTLLATQTAALPSYTGAGKVTVNSGSTLAVRAGGAGEWDSGQIGGLLGTTAFQSGSSLGIDVTGTNSFSYAGNIGVTQANKGFVKSGLGKLTLTGDNTYTGATNVNEGTLIVNGNNSLATGVVTVAAGATLGGNGTIGGATTVYGTLSPGVSPVVLMFASPVTLDSASTTLMEIVGATDSPGVSQDQIVVLSNQLTYGGTLALDMGTTLGVGAYTWDLFDFGSETGTWNAIKLQNQYSGSLADVDANGVWDLTSGLNTWQFTESNGVLNLTVVPEPSTLALLAIAGVVGGGVQLRRYFRRGRHEKRSA